MRACTSVLNLYTLIACPARLLKSYLSLSRFFFLWQMKWTLSKVSHTHRRSDPIFPLCLCVSALRARPCFSSPILVTETQIPCYVRATFVSIPSIWSSVYFTTYETSCTVFLQLRQLFSEAFVLVQCPSPWQCVLRKLYVCVSLLCRFYQFNFESLCEGNVNDDDGGPQGVYVLARFSSHGIFSHSCYAKLTRLPLACTYVLSLHIHGALRLHLAWCGIMYA